MGSTLAHAATTRRRFPWWKRRRPMQTVFSVLMVVGLLVILYPFLPQLQYALFPPAISYPYASRLALPEIPTTPGGLPDPAAKPLPEGNRLVIPKIGVDIAIAEGANEYALLKGAWRIPSTSASPTEGNMVLSAHRFRYRPPASTTFYLLDKLAVGDVFIVYWEGAEYDYRVAETRTVPPSAVEILAPTDSPIVTLFTCTPLFSTANRLVVVGEPL